MILRAASLALLMAMAGTAMAAPCRQALVLALDVSGSVDAGEYQLQKDGLAAALVHPDVVRAIEAGPDAEVRLYVFEWAGVASQRVLIDWIAVTSGADLAQVSARLSGARRVAMDGATALGAAMRHAARALAPHEGCWRQTVDISGDGKSNTGPLPRAIRDTMGRITVNALVIGEDEARAADRQTVGIGELVAYFRAEVIRGGDAFTLAALGFADYERAMVEKLVRELEGGVFSQLP